MDGRNTTASRLVCTLYSYEWHPCRQIQLCWANLPELERPRHQVLLWRGSGQILQLCTFLTPTWLSLHSLKSSWLFCLWSSFCANLLMKMVRIHGYSSLMYLLHIYEGMECLVCDFNHLLDWLHLPFHVRQQQGLLLTKDVSHHDGPLITSGWFYFLISIPPLIASIYTFLTGIQTTVDLIRILRLCILPPT